MSRASRMANLLAHLDENYGYDRHRGVDICEGDMPEDDLDRLANDGLLGEWYAACEGDEE